MFKDRTDAAVNFCKYPTRITGSRCETVLDRISVSAMLDASLFTQFDHQMESLSAVTCYWSRVKNSVVQFWRNLPMSM